MQFFVVVAVLISASKGNDLTNILNEINGVNATNCGQLQDDELKLDLNIDYSAFSHYTVLPVYISNVYSRNINEEITNGTLDRMPDSIFFNLPQTSVITGLSIVYSAPLAFERRVFTKHDLFAPDTVNKDGTVISIDLSQLNDYTKSRPYNEWYTVHADKIWASPKTLKQTTTYRDNNVTIVVTHRVDETDGQWIEPYYDCARTHEWLVSYSVPFYAKLPNGEPVFEGVSAIDIRLSDLDVNQCDDVEPSDVFFNAFTETHKCPPLSKCVFKPGHGFRAGGYVCDCNNGAELSGLDVEQADESQRQGMCKDAKTPSAVQNSEHPMVSIKTKSGSELEHLFEVMQNVNNDTCNSGTSVSLDLYPDYSRWERLTLIALLNANYMTLRIHQRGGTYVTRERTYYRFTQYAIAAGLPTGKGSGIAYNPAVVPNYGTFAPYSMMKGDDVITYDMSTSYNYQDAIWYEPLAARQWDDVSSILTRTNISGTVQDATILYATRSDGQWTQPYFDCGRNNIWMVTFSAPILKKDQNNIITFEGVATTDIDLTNVDINQCGKTDKTVDAFQNAFMGTHKCPPFTKCVFKPGFGFTRGGYTCLCRNKSGKSIEGETLEVTSPPSLQQLIQECQ